MGKARDAAQVNFLRRVGSVFTGRDGIKKQVEKKERPKQDQSRAAREARRKRRQAVEKEQGVRYSQAKGLK